MGTGTGILAIAAAALGAERVVAIDTDPEASQAAMRNLALNKCADRVQVFHGGVEVLGPDMRCDLLLANLDAKILRGLFDTLRTLLAPRGRAICSGILAGEEGEITAAVRASRLRVVARRGEGEWLCLTLTAEGCEGQPVLA